MAKRLPILLWGDLVQGRKPVLRRALAGFRAHECMYAWVYLTDYLALRRLQRALSELDAPDLLFRHFDEKIWSRLDRSTIDPHFQLNKAAFETAALVTALCATTSDEHPLLIELGATFFASKTKFEIVDAVASKHIERWRALKPEWVGLDNSRFMHDVAHELHGDGIEILDDYLKFRPSQRFSIFYSRFVASYAFPGSDALAKYLANNFQAVVLEDAFATVPQDIPVTNHGQDEVFFDIAHTIRTLEAQGFEAYLLDSYPDFPAQAAPCHVVKLLAVRRGIALEKLSAIVDALGFTFGPAAQRIDSVTILRRLNDAVTPGIWRHVRRAKEIPPCGDELRQPRPLGYSWIEREMLPV
jgi:hypothetical protein